MYVELATNLRTETAHREVVYLVTEGCPSPWRIIKIDPREENFGQTREKRGTVVGGGTNTIKYES